MEYRRGDVRDAAALDAAIDGADVVVHLAFLITGNASSDTIRSINVDGTLNTFRATARATTVQRFVYASSVAAYGFHRDNPARINEEWPTRPARRLFYQAREGRDRAFARRSVAAASRRGALCAAATDRARAPRRGSEACGAGAVRSRRCGAGTRRCTPASTPAVPGADLPLQLIHEDDVGRGSCSASSVPALRALRLVGSGVVYAARCGARGGLGLCACRTRSCAPRAHVVAAIPLPVPQAGWIEVAADRPWSTPARPNASSVGPRATAGSSHSAPPSPTSVVPQTVDKFDGLWDDGRLNRVSRSGGPWARRSSTTLVGVCTRRSARPFLGPARCTASPPRPPA